MTVASAVGCIHIPKTGGSSFFKLLASRLPSRNVSVYDFFNFGDDLARVNFLSGHVPFYSFAFENRERRLCTILRNPIDRVISHYKYILASPGHYAHAYVTSRKLSIRDMLDHPVLKLENSNFQTKLLGWTPKNRMAWPAIGPDFSRACQDYNEMIYENVSEETIAKAMDRLSNGLEFALTEDPGSWERLYEKLIGEQLPSQIPRINITPSSDYVVSAADIEATVANNMYDLRLYQFASEKIPRLTRQARPRYYRLSAQVDDGLTLNSSPVVGH